MMFFVPFIAMCCVVRVPLCRRSEQLSAARIRDIRRGCLVILAGVAVTLASEWIAVIIRANRSNWSNATLAQIVVLVLLSLWTIFLTRAVSRGTIRALLQTGHNEIEPDWLADILLLATTPSGLGPLRSLVAPILTLTDRRIVPLIRRHPLWSATAIWGVFGLAVGLRQSISEGYSLGSSVVLIVLLSGGMFGLCVATGNVLGFVRTPHPLSGARRRGADALVITSLGVLVPFALRFHLWWIVRSTNSTAGLNQLVALLSISAIVIFGVSLGVETALRCYDRPTESSNLDRAN
jgi:hypothetical protein